MNIGLLDGDKKGRHNFPNLALMKISAWHKLHGDNVEMVFPLQYYDRVYLSKVFDDSISPPLDFKPLTKDLIVGGSGYDLHRNLPDEIEHIYPDYDLYGIRNTAYGFLSRGCPRACPFCIVAEKEGRISKKVADLDEWFKGQKEIVLLDPNILACKECEDLLRQLSDSGARVDFNQGLDARLLTEKKIELLNKVQTKMLHFAWDSMSNSESILKGLELYSKFGAVKNFRLRTVYVLVNFNTSMKENLYRIYTLRELGYSPFVMVYDKANAPREIKRLQRWCNNRFVFRKCLKFEDYQ